MKKEYIKFIVIFIFAFLVIIAIYSVITSMAPAGWYPGKNIFELIKQGFAKLLGG